MKDHERAGCGPAQRVINRMPSAARHVLYQLNGDRDRYYLGEHKLYYREPVLTRTVSGRHYRMAPAMAELLMADVAQPAGAHPTQPPTVLATVEETLNKLQDYVMGSELDARGVANGIREALGMPISPWSNDKD